MDAVKNLNEVSSMHGLGRFFKQLKQSARSSANSNVDDFLGCVTIPVSDISSRGTEKWYTLQARSDKSQVSGEVYLKVENTQEHSM